MTERITTWHNVYDWGVTAGWTSRKGAEDENIANTVCLFVYRIERDEDGSNPEIFVEEV